MLEAQAPDAATTCGQQEGHGRPGYPTVPATIYQMYHDGNKARSNGCTGKTGVNERTQLRQHSRHQRAFLADKDVGPAFQPVSDRLESRSHLPARMPYSFRRTA